MRPMNLPMRSQMNFQFEVLGTNVTLKDLCRILVSLDVIDKEFLVGILFGTLLTPDRNIIRLMSQHVSHPIVSAHVDFATTLALVLCSINSKAYHVI